ncbi:zinc metalloprotease [Actinocorallia sp. API 0066]|uniref:zinc metalloprotease n=1 Tax=Actinocorallia sp. API 0066 TaxID=2896846 RepID=UPI001E41FB2F|nr:zinc metalloprotease [Actinocorallia sp. API 0066]MCD0453185.1 zinc metalloprotease [Actinocorallia sp. API 0066]
MKSVKLAAIGLSVAVVASVPQLAQAKAPQAPAPAPAAAAEECLDDHGHAPATDDHSVARVRKGGKAVEPHSRVSPDVEAAVQFELTKQNLLTRSQGAKAATKWLHIPVYFHVIHYGNKGKLSKKAVNKQIDVLDRGYKGAAGGHNLKINFYLKKITYTNKGSWFKDPQKYETTYKRKLRKGGKASLNLYTADLGKELLGWATFPWDYKKQPKRDGAVLHYQSLPGGNLQEYSLGNTAVHEVGHWLGLYHTFGRDYPYKDGCAAGDRVADTPDQAVPTTGCPADDAIPDTCPSEGLDPIHNYMDYGTDVCMTEFTKGQNDRVRALWKKYRAPATKKKK